MSDASNLPSSGKELQNRLNSLFPGKYEVKTLLGEGGMGEVYKVWHVPLQVFRAFKIVILDKRTPGDLKIIRARLQREARLAARVSGAHCVHIEDYHEFPDGYAYLEMEYVPGVTLNKWLLQKSHDLMARLQVIVGLCKGAAEIHHIGVVHRDLKPENIMVGKPDEGGNPRVTILDFGLVFSPTAGELFG